jgi:RND family efflux transporter MFP subunit
MARRGRFGSFLLYLTGVLVIGGAALGAWRMRYDKGMSLSASREALAEGVARGPVVQVVQVKEGPKERLIQLLGEARPYQTATLYSKVSGYVTSIAVDRGDHVKAGDLLAQITAPELDHQISQNQATLQQNEAALQQTTASRDLANVTNTRDSDLVKKGWLTPQQGDTDRLTLQAQNASVAVAQANVAAQQSLIRVLQQQKSYQSVVAPFDGIITQRNVDVGSLVEAGTTFMFTLMQSDVIRTQVYVPQDAAFGVTKGVEAVVRVPEIPDHTFPGTVTRLADALAPGTRTLLTEIDVPNPDGLLRPGMYCTVELHIPRETPSLIVPADAVVFNTDGLQVAAVENGVAHYQKITVARDLGTQVEVSAGVRAGDQVILRPMVQLLDGSKVQVEAPATEISQK